MYIKHIELSRFKSFGGTTPIPMLPGFTVVSGPNGSGKSNILDALLFALGLSSSKGMRADRLPDLVNQTHAKKGRTVEASVTVIFALDEEEGGQQEESGQQSAVSDQLEEESGHRSSVIGQLEEEKAESRELIADSSSRDWKVTRKLRVTSQGTYTSTYYINDAPCTLTELHEQLAKLRIYPEGYNVVLQGDVTSIISMNSRDRREIIDELAGVGEFDRKINQAKDKLDDVKAQEDRFRIVEAELVTAQEKLKGDRAKAEKYQVLRAELEQMQASEVVLQQRQFLYQKGIKRTELANCEQTAWELGEQIEGLKESIATATTELNDLNSRVYTLGEEEYLSLSTDLANRSAELRATQRQQQELTTNYQANQDSIVTTQVEIDEYLQQLEQVAALKQKHEEEIEGLTKARDQQASVVAKCRHELQAIASASSVWLNQQSQLRNSLDTLQAAIDPQKQEYVRLKESIRQWSLQVESLTKELKGLENVQGNSLEEEVNLCMKEASGAQSLIQSLAINLSDAQIELQTTRETIERLQQEQRIKSRQLDRLEAEIQAQQEVQGTKATKVIMEADLSGVYGLVAQLGWVEPKFQLALEISAGNRMSNLVVESDEVAAEAINLLKLERAGRATFLPLNKMKAARKLNMSDAAGVGAIDFAANLIQHEPRYANIFAYIFGNTLVYEHLELARMHIGKYRMVTLEGDLLETTGAMTGGSLPSRSGFRFGTSEPTESAEMRILRERLLEIEHMLTRLNQKIRTTQVTVTKYEEQLQSARTAQREAQMQRDRFNDQLERHEKERERLQSQIKQNQSAIEIGRSQLASVELSVADLEAQIQITRQQLAELEQSSTHTRWQHAQELLQTQDQKLNEAELSLRSVRQQLTDTDTQKQLFLEKISQRQSRLQERRTMQADLLNRSTHAQTQCRQLESQVEQLQERLNSLEQIIGTAKQERDACDRKLRTHQTQQQQLEWQRQKTNERRTELEQQITQVNLQLEQIELPDPLPEVAENMSLEQLQLEQRRLQKRLQAMEPVNMMAIAEYEATTNRLNELSGRLETLNQERTELLLRIENFTTLRQRAFMQAFDAINENFKTIFAELSDGDGYLQLENAAAPLSGGLNLVAHPKGKLVTHLASMSGGEKSLTALSFIFALQRYRPSPFYAFDEVDMFLDGANVERLARMVRKQADSAQFIVVSLRRPMIESAERTIGVTQARGAHTQVLGLELRSS